jgi:hypothetical protein
MVSLAILKKKDFQTICEYYPSFRYQIDLLINKQNVCEALIELHRSRLRCAFRKWKGRCFKMPEDENPFDYIPKNLLLSRTTILKAAKQKRSNTESKRVGFLADDLIREDLNASKQSV